MHSHNWLVNIKATADGRFLTTIELIQSVFYPFSQTLAFPIHLFFFLRPYGVQEHFGWSADSKTTLDLQAVMESLPRLKFQVLRDLSERPV